MNKDRALTYSLLAHIRNTGSLAKGPIDIFIPLAKRALSKMNTTGTYSGKSLMEIKEITDELYGIDFPVPVLKKLLVEIAKEVNTEDSVHFQLYQDGAFSIKEYTFSEFEDVIKEKNEEIKNIEKLFQEFCTSSDLEIESSDSIFEFIETNKFLLSQYLSHNKLPNKKDFTAEAQFIVFFKKIPDVYNSIKNIYLGSIIAGYIEYSRDEVKREILLLLDTNFIVGLLDLNTIESTHTCQTLLKIAKQEGFSIKVLEDTIVETKGLLEAKAANFDKSFLQRKVNPEDIYNACERRKISRTDLERVSDNVEQSLQKLGVSVIYNNDKLKKEAQFTEVYKNLIHVRHSKNAAMHDAIAILYVEKQRKKKKIKDFEKVNAWFVNNSISKEGNERKFEKKYQPISIKADDLLNILWLSNPQVNDSISAEDLVEIGLTSTVSLELNKSLPKSKILRELDDNIHKYAEEKISDTDIVRVATRITNKQLKDIDELNKLAESNKEGFIKRLEEEALKQKELENKRIERLEKFFTDISSKTKELDDTKKEFEIRSKEIDSIIDEKNIAQQKLAEYERLENEKGKEELRIKRESWESEQVSKWRRKTWIELVFWVLLITVFAIYLLFQASWNLNRAKQIYAELEADILIGSAISIVVMIMMYFTIRSLYDKYRNLSNVNSFKAGLKFPEELEG